jgi:predicted ATP-grasp superfamily ATP-dependent carboligase
MIPAAATGTLVVAGLSARVLAESAAQAGFGVVALDLFGDLDTRSACRQWLPLAAAGASAIDAGMLAAALHAAAQMPGVVGWVAGSGFEAAASWLDAAPATLPLLGMASAEVNAVRDPRRFFATLARLGLPHPATRFEPPAEAHGWLVKHPGGSGGWHIRRAEPTATTQPGSYFQREECGLAMSALILADGRAARLVALNRLHVRPLGALPFVYRGAVGPLVAPALQARVEQALAALVPAFALRGLASLDFIAQGDTPLLLEINPRPSASMELHARAWPEGLLHWHLQALRGQLPPPPRHASGLRGCEIVFARRAGCVTPALSAKLAADADCHDLPQPGTRFAAGSPVCSVGAAGDTENAVDHALHSRLTQTAALLTSLPTEYAERAP